MRHVFLLVCMYLLLILLTCWLFMHLMEPAEPERVRCFADLQGGQVAIDGDVWTLLPPGRAVCDVCGETWDAVHGCDD